MKNRIAVVFLVLLGTLMVGSCATTKSLTVSPAFWKQKDKAIGIALVQFPRGSVQNFGSSMGNLAQQLKDEARMASATAALESQLRRTYPGNFARVQDLFAEKLQATGFKVVKIGDKVNLKHLPKGKLSSSEYPQHDYRPVGQRAGVDRLIVLQLTGFGTACLFTGTYPQGTQVKVQVRGEMIDVETDKLFWRTEFAKGSFSRAVEGKCTDPADFPTIHEAVKQDVDKAVRFLYEDFFGERPGLL